MLFLSILFFMLTCSSEILHLRCDLINLIHFKGVHLLLINMIHTQQVIIMIQVEYAAWNAALSAVAVHD